jgi:hypothetical protein
VLPLLSHNTSASKLKRKETTRQDKTSQEQVKNKPRLEKTSQEQVQNMPRQDKTRQEKRRQEQDKTRLD